MTLALTYPCINLSHKVAKIIWLKVLNFFTVISIFTSQGHAVKIFLNLYVKFQSTLENKSHSLTHSSSPHFSSVILRLCDQLLIALWHSFYLFDKGRSTKLILNE